MRSETQEAEPRPVGLDRARVLMAVVAAGLLIFAVAARLTRPVDGGRVQEEQEGSRANMPASYGELLAELSEAAEEREKGEEVIGMVDPGDIARLVHEYEAMSGDYPRLDAVPEAPEEVEDSLFEEALAAETALRLSGAGDDRSGPAGQSIAGFEEFERQAHKGLDGFRTAGLQEALPPGDGVGLAVRAGTAIPAALVTGISTDFPGPVMARVTRDVLDASGRYVAVPRGAVALGAYVSATRAAQKRVRVRWTSLELPNGRSVDLGGAQSFDAVAGGVGLRDKSKDHWGQIFGQAAALALVGVGTSYTSSDERGDGSLSDREIAGDAVAREYGRASTEILRRNAGEIKPTIEIRQGHEVVIFLTKEIRV